jgi:hypothetical protein
MFSSMSEKLNKLRPLMTPRSEADAWASINKTTGDAMALLESYQKALALAKEESGRTGQVVHFRPVGATFWEVTSQALRAREQDEREHLNGQLQRESEEWLAQEGMLEDARLYEHQERREQDDGPAESDDA